MIKLIFEINIKPVWLIHLFSFAAELLDFAFMIICFFYIIEDKNLELKINLKEFESHLKYINIIWYAKVFYAILVILFPFRFMGLVSFWKSVFDPFGIIINIVLRMVPSILISFLCFSAMIIIFVFINYFIFNDAIQSRI